jgi:hypothetical protein
LRQVRCGYEKGDVPRRTPPYCDLGRELALLVAALPILLLIGLAALLSTARLLALLLLVVLLWALLLFLLLVVLILLNTVLVAHGILLEVVGGLARGPYGCAKSPAMTTERWVLYVPRVNGVLSIK